MASESTQHGLHLLIYTLINLAVVMDYDGQLSKEDAGTVCLSILLVVVVFW